MFNNDVSDDLRFPDGQQIVFDETSAITDELASQFGSTCKIYIYRNQIPFFYNYISAISYHFVI